MKWIGLTGNIATGKSTVAKMCKDLGLAVLDADKLAREVVEPEEFGFRAVVEAFGTKVLEKGEINRSKLREIIFSNPESRLVLERIIHPLVQWRVAQEARELKRQGIKTVIYDVPLLFEKGYQDRFDHVIVVSCSKEDQLKRLLARDKCTKEVAEKIISSQLPIDDKRRQADYVIDNSLSEKQVKEQLKAVLEELKVL